MRLLEECQELFGSENLFEIFKIDDPKSATESKIKKAYYKLSLKYHPDKANENERDAHTKKFQVLTKIHQILSDKQKRELYIETGEIDDDGPGFDDNTDLTDYWRQIYPKVTLEQIKKFTEEYQGSEEERNDLLDAFKKHKGKMGKIMEVIPASTYEDEDRFVKILKQAIKDKEVKSYKAFTNESAGSKRERREAALEEQDEAEQHAKDLGISKTKDTDDLAALILSKNKARGSFLDDLEAKYAPKPKKAKTGKKGKAKKT